MEKKLFGEIKKITVIDKDGTKRQFDFQKCLGFDSWPEKLICKEIPCPYQESCDKFKDPRDTENKDSDFAEFCSNFEIEDELILDNYIPTPGSIERGFKDMED